MQGGSGLSFGNGALDDVAWDSWFATETDAGSLPRGQSCPRPLTEEATLVGGERGQREVTVRGRDVDLQSDEGPVLAGDAVHQARYIEQRGSAVGTFGHDKSPGPSAKEPVEHRFDPRAQQVGVHEHEFVGGEKGLE